MVINFYTLLDQSVYSKVVEYKKLNNFYIGGFSCNVEQIGLYCEKNHKAIHRANSEISEIKLTLEPCIS